MRQQAESFCCLDASLVPHPSGSRPAILTPATTCGSQANTKPLANIQALIDSTAYPLWTPEVESALPMTSPPPAPCAACPVQGRVTGYVGLSDCRRMAGIKQNRILEVFRSGRACRSSVVISTLMQVFYNDPRHHFHSERPLEYDFV